MGQDANQNPPALVGSEQGEPNGAQGSSPPAPWLPTGMALLGFAIIAWTMLRGAKRRMRRGQDQSDGTPRERLDRIRASAERERAQEFASDAVELTQRLAAQLDAKAAFLEELLAQADERLASLAQALASRDERGQGGARAAVVRSAYSPGDRSIDGTPLDFGGRSVHLREDDRLGRVTEIEGERPDAMRREIFRLADSGLDADEIARRTEQPIGQVRLILALRRS